MKNTTKIIAIGLLVGACFFHSCKCDNYSSVRGQWKLVSITTPKQTKNNLGYTEILKENLDTLNTSTTGKRAFYSLTFRNGVIVDKHLVEDEVPNCKENNVIMHYQDGLQRKYIFGNNMLKATGYVNSIGSPADSVTYNYEVLY